jgi:hypothetical protein
MHSMKYIILTTIASLLILIPIQAQDYEFPKLGDTYMLKYALNATSSSDPLLPEQVTILKKGSELWCFVEFMKIEEGQPKPIKRKIWLNFALILSATEVP